MKQEYYTTSQNIKMPKLIYGTAWKKDKTKDLVIQAVEAGFRGIDTACQPKHYNEFLVGEALKELKKNGIDRKDLYLQTKFTSVSGQDLNTIPYDKNATLENQVIQSFEKSKSNLNTEYIDSLVLHSPMNNHKENMIVWNTFEKFYFDGGVKQLGISNCYDLDVLKMIYDNVEIKPSVIQNRFYKNTDYDKEIRKFCNSKNIIYQSFWTLTANPHILESSEIKNISNKLDKTHEQVFFRYLTQVGIAPLTGTTNLKHMKQDLDIFSFTLSDNELNIIAHLL